MIHRILAKNFLSWKLLDFSVNSGVTLIDGWNEDDQTSEGSGKSAVLNAMCWCLYGKLPKDTNIDDVIKHGEKKCEVAVVFDKFSVVRSRKPNDLYIQTDKQIKGKDAKETQILIEQYVGLSFETFCQTVYFAQNYPKKFITANQEDKAKMLAEVQDLKIFDRARKEVMALGKVEEKNMMTIAHEIDIAKKDLELVAKDIEHQNTLIENAKRRKQEELNSLQLQIDSIKNRKTELQAKLETITKEYTACHYSESRQQELLDKQDILYTEYLRLASDLKNADFEIQLRERKKAEGEEYGRKYNKLRQQKEELVAFIENPTRDCPACGTTLKNCDTRHAENEVDEISRQLKEIEEFLVGLHAELSSAIPDKLAINGKLTEITKEREAVKTELDQMFVLDKRTTELKITMETLAKQSSEMDNDVRKLSEKYEEVKVAEPKIDTSNLEVLNNKKDELDKLILTLRCNLNESELHLHRLNTLKSGFKEIKSYVFNSILNEINVRVNQYLAQLFEVSANIKFRNDSMKIETDITLDGKPMSLGLLSGGQFRRFSLATDLALSDVISARKNARAGVLILDEYFKDLSENSMEKCLTLLETRKQPVLLIEHNSLFKNIVDNSFFVKLENGTSTHAS